MNKADFKNQRLADVVETIRAVKGAKYAEHLVDVAQLLHTMGQGACLAEKGAPHFMLAMLADIAGVQAITLFAKITGVSGEDVQTATCALADDTSDMGEKIRKELGL